jgi:hypothetical protein
MQFFMLYNLLMMPVLVFLAKIFPGHIPPKWPLSGYLVPFRSSSTSVERLIPPGLVAIFHTLQTPYHTWSLFSMLQIF